MTGDDLTSGILLFVVGLLAVCVPAAIAAMIRRVAAEDTGSSGLLPYMLTPLVYLAGSLAWWAMLVVVGWDGSKPLSQLIIFPASKAFWISGYAILVGVAFAIFSVRISSARKMVSHHFWLFIWCSVAMSVFMTFAEAGMEKALSKTSLVPTSSEDAYPLDEAARLDLMLDQMASSYSPLNPKSANFDRELALRLEARVGVLERQGIHATAALKQAVGEMTPIELSMPPMPGVEKNNHSKAASPASTSAETTSNMNPTSNERCEEKFRATMAALGDEISLGDYVRFQNAAQERLAACKRT